MTSSFRPPKRLASALDDDVNPAKRSETSRSDESTSTFANSFAAAPSTMEIRAFGLEDRAEAVISRGKDTWTLVNLSKWRHDALDTATNTTASQHSSSRSISSKEYLRQRQRAYRHQILAASREQHKQLDA